MSIQHLDDLIVHLEWTGKVELVDFFLIGSDKDRVTFHFKSGRKRMNVSVKARKVGQKIVLYPPILDSVNNFGNDIVLVNMTLHALQQAKRSISFNKYDYTKSRNTIKGVYLDEC